MPWFVKGESVVPALLWGKVKQKGNSDNNEVKGYTISVRHYGQFQHGE